VPTECVYSRWLRSNDLFFCISVISVFKTESIRGMDSTYHGLSSTYSVVEYGVVWCGVVLTIWALNS